MTGDLAPSLRTILLDALHEDAVLILRPGALNHLRVQHLLPPMQALHISAIFQLLSNLLPVFRAHLGNEVTKFFVLISGPVALATLLFVELVEVESQGVTILVFIFIAGELGLCTRVFAIF